MHCDVLIVGAGVAGSAAAIQLARAGFDVVLVERQRFPRRKVCGECVSANCLHLLDELGVAAPAGPPLDTVVLACGRTSIAAPLPPTSVGRHRWGCAIAREALDPALLAAARAAGVRVLQPARVLAVQGGLGDTTCSVESLDGEQRTRSTVTCRAVIAAKGSWDASLVPVARAHGGLLAFRATFANASLLSGHLPVLALPGGYGGMVIGADDVLTLACCLRTDVLHGLRDAGGHGPGEAVENYLRRECKAVAEALDGAQRNGGWIGSGPIAPGVRVVPGQPVFLLGNAAGEAHPILGEGISMALHGARLVAQHLAALDRLDAERLQLAQVAYARSWQRRFAGRIRASRIAVALAMRPVLAPALLPALRRWPALLTLAARVGGKAQFAVAAPAA
jgi:flavin-dependent dehydrogenase